MTEPTERCPSVCIPYFQEVAATLLTEEPRPELQWVTEPDVRNPFPVHFTFQCPHQVTWMCQPTSIQVQKWEQEYPLQPEVFPDPFICNVDGTCDYSVRLQSPTDVQFDGPLEVALAVMLDHILTAHGATFWMGMQHLTATYPGLNAYCGSEQRIAKYAPQD